MTATSPYRVQSADIRVHGMRISSVSTEKNAENGSWHGMCL